MFMPPHQDITDMFWISAQIMIKFVMKLFQARSRQIREVIKYVLRCHIKQWMSLVWLKTYLWQLSRSLYILYITSNSPISFVWAIKLITDNLPCSLNPFWFPICVLELRELMMRVKNCWRSAKWSRYMWYRLTHHNMIHLWVIHHIVIVVQCSFCNAQRRPDSRFISCI